MDMSEASFSRWYKDKETGACTCWACAMEAGYRLRQSRNMHRRAWRMENIKSKFSPILATINDVTMHWIGQVVFTVMLLVTGFLAWKNTVSFAAT